MFKATPNIRIYFKSLQLASQKLTEPQECQRLLEPAGLVDTGVRKKQLGYHLQSAEDWWAIIWNSGARRLINRLSDDQRMQFRINHTKHIQTLASDKGIWLDVEVLYSSGVVA